MFEDEGVYRFYFFDFFSQQHHFFLLRKRTQKSIPFPFLFLSILFKASAALR